jgi:hypothetical protein
MAFLAKAASAKIRRWLASAGLAGVTMISINLLRMLPYSMARVRVTDAMTLPGGLLADLYEFAFGETKNWLVTWTWLAIFGNALFYVVLWYVVISVYELLRRRSGTSGEVT